MPSDDLPEDAEREAVTVLQSQLEAAAETVLAGIPDHLRALIPMGLSPAERIAWFQSAKATGIFDKAAVPATPTPPPAITPKTPDTSSLPIHARLAAGYSK
jgi:hypothetical protein